MQINEAENTQGATNTGTSPEVDDRAGGAQVDSGRGDLPDDSPGIQVMGPLCIT